MNGVCSALRYKCHLSTGRAASIGGRVACRDAEFLKRIERGAQCPGKSESLSLVIVVNPVERDVGLVTASTVDRSAAAVGGRADAAAVAGVDDTRLQTQNAGSFS